MITGSRWRCGTATRTPCRSSSPPAPGAASGPATLPEFVAALERPRRIMMLVKAGKPVDDVLAQLEPLLETGDIVIDGGNTHFADTRRREEALRGKGVSFVGMGV